jgi:hypothetical protein
MTMVIAKRLEEVIQRRRERGGAAPSGEPAAAQTPANGIRP